MRSWRNLRPRKRRRLRNGKEDAIEMANETVAVIGAGTMGNGIAEVFAVAGYAVRLYDATEAALERGLQAIAERVKKRAERGRLAEDPAAVLARIAPMAALEEAAGAALVIEAVVERLDVKREVFRTLDAACGPETILATNTSSLSVTEIAAATTRPERVVGLHFFNPAPVMPLVEVIAGKFSAPEAVEAAVRFVEAAGKVPIRAQDTPGFIVNRVARPFYNEALRIVGDRVATIEQVDRILKAAGFRMGPFELQDLIGLDINFATTTSVYEAFFHDPRFRPHPIQRMMVSAGALGRKTGRGYYRYDGE